jgi:hypothetical protein
MLLLLLGFEVRGIIGREVDGMVGVVIHVVLLGVEVK